MPKSKDGAFVTIYKLALGRGEEVAVRAGDHASSFSTTCK